MDNIRMPYSDEEKIAHFFREVGREFDRREKEQNAALEKEREAAVEKARADIAAEITAYKNAKIGEYMSELSGKTSREILDAKHKSLSATEKFIDEIRACVERKLREFTADEDKYFAYLADSCKRAAAFVGEGFEMYLSPQDAERFGEKLADAPGMLCTVNPDETIKLGGLRMCQNDRGISVDETLDAKLDGKMDEFAKSGI